MNTAPSFPEDPVREKLASLLAAGVTKTAAALAVGVDPSYLSQLLEDEKFRTAVAEKSAGRIQEDLAHDDTIESTEAQALKVLAAKLPYIKSAGEAAKIFSILNKAEKRATPANQSQDAAGMQVVSLTIPKAAKVNIQINAQNQVIDVEGRSMAPLPSSALPKLLADKQAQEVALKKLDRKEHIVVARVM